MARCPRKLLLHCHSFGGVGGGLCGWRSARCRLNTPERFLHYSELLYQTERRGEEVHRHHISSRYFTGTRPRFFPLVSRRKPSMSSFFPTQICRGTEGWGGSATGERGRGSRGGARSWRTGEWHSGMWESLWAEAKSELTCRPLWSQQFSAWICIRCVQDVCVCVCERERVWKIVCI